MTNANMVPVVNAATGYKYPFMQGSAEEANLFRVMPVEAGSGTKLYFDSREQYMSWRTAKLGSDKSLRQLGVCIIPGRAYKPMTETMN